MNWPGCSWLRQVELTPGTTLDFPIEAGLWYACERCHRYIKGNGWAALARNMGYPEGHAGSEVWQSFRVAREKGPGYAWPLVESKTPEVAPGIARAWGETVAEFDGEQREVLESVHLVTVIHTTLYARTSSEETVKHLRDGVGPDLIRRFQSRFHSRSGCQMKVALYADRPTAG
ncbi:hypothetical protein [Streptomyces sp. NPDC059788]|uniref:hypothetical protein n=1 Tax=Streptomyces sp. NPDC059788 TaxID=3346948 RepID=UPI003668FEA9